MANTLTRKVGATFVPIVLETLVKHYIDRIRKEISGKNTTTLRQDELLYDQAFTIVKNFLAAASHHTVEECQSFANTRTPAPPWVRVVRVLIPISSCNEAAEHLIKALGGDEQVKRTVGGTKWWQVRGVEGVDSQWIVAKKDWRKAKKRFKEQERRKGSRTSDDQNSLGTPDDSDGAELETDDHESNKYHQDMDEMRCIFYLHGGGYYFGSVDQERYSLQRHARKINGRVFAINYRLAPQYPFPCAIQDALAAYLFLIQPPDGALHRPVNPIHIILAGDSAGGGIALALLQILRDTGLPVPAGAVLISPWCDLSHSFLSIHTNTKTDVIPEYGLSMQKPSTLWPPPSDEMTRNVHASLRNRIRQMVHLDGRDKAVYLSAKPKAVSHQKSGSIFNKSQEKRGPDHMPLDVGTTATAPPLNSPENQTISLIAKSGETLTIDQQVHLYAQNSLIVHPLISPALSYLGGLPPLLVIASDKEVLRDEIIYTAHKAANPSKYPIKDESREMYPSLKGIEKRYGPTAVHLQVYDDAAHVLPVLFSFTTPAKFCFRAIATFCRQVTGMAPKSQPQSQRPNSPILAHSSAHFTMSPEASTSNLNAHHKGPIQSHTESDVGNPKSNTDSDTNQSLPSDRSAKSLRKCISAVMAIHRNSPPINSSGEEIPFVPKLPMSKETEDVAGPRFHGPSIHIEGQRKAGDWIDKFPPLDKAMIRERVSTRGFVTPLEPESELDAFRVPQEIIGAFSELAVKRYLDAKIKFDKKFSGVQKVIDKRRQRNLELSKKDISRNIQQLQGDVPKRGRQFKGRGNPTKGLKEGIEASWSWAWALEPNERPPPSSIVSRRDTEEARQFARIADQASLEEDCSMSGNQLWAFLVDLVTMPPGKHKYLSTQAPGGDQNGEPTVPMPIKRLSILLPERKEVASTESVEHAFAIDRPQAEPEFRTVNLSTEANIVFDALIDDANEDEELREWFKSLSSCVPYPSRLHP